MSQTPDLPPDQAPQPKARRTLLPAPGFSRVPPPIRHPDPDPAAPPAGNQTSLGEPASEPAGAPAGPTGRTRTEALDPKLLARRATPYEAIARGALRALGGLLNGFSGVDDDDESWIPDQDDDRDIPKPLGRLAARRVPIDIGDASLTDLEDMAAAGVGGIAYVIKGLVSMIDNRRRRRREIAGAAVHNDPGEGD